VTRFIKSAFLACTAAFACTHLTAAAYTLQNGDKPGEEQPEVDRRWPSLPSPPLSPEEQLATFRVPEGYVIEAVATEPLIGDPVDIAWDADGRMWVVEMTSLMRDAEGTDELEPDCSIVILSDTDGDRIYDHREVFLDGLVLPRSVCFVPDGVVAILPPQIVFLQDEDGDGSPDRREVIADGLTAGLSNPEHAANSLTLGLDNWLYVANHGKRYRRVEGEWISERSARIGQWGMSEDDHGRMAVNYNSSAAHASVVPLAESVRNEAYGSATGTNLATTGDTRVFSARVNPGVNRGYRSGTLREDGHLARLTGACGPAWFTGVALEDADRGRLFSCEPCANLVQRFDVVDVQGQPKATLIRNKDGLDFLTSTDERFRPVNLRVGPDGALYVVDLYRGILQHKVFLTSFLRRQAEERGLATPTGLGRIWRITRQDAELATPTSLQDLSPEDLIVQLGSHNKWQRMTAQRLLVERGASRELSRDLFDAIVAAPESQLAIHALNVMEGIGAQLNEEQFQELPHSLWSTQPAVLAGAKLFPDDQVTAIGLMAVSKGDDPPVQWAGIHVLHRFPEFPHVAFLGERLLAILKDKVAASALLAGFSDLDWETAKTYCLNLAMEGEHPASVRFLQDLGGLIIDQAQEQVCFDLLDYLGHATPHWTRRALLVGAANALPQTPDPSRYRFRGPPPETWVVNRAVGMDPELGGRIDRHLQWGAPQDYPTADLPLDLQRGAEVYRRSCGTCHQPEGSGMQGLAPPFRASEWLLLPERRLADIALNGLNGPIEVAGKEWDMEMPGWSVLSDEEIADVLNYIQHRWSMEPKMVTPETVADVRAHGVDGKSED
jgi:mono/diheme cytochrome c family protein/glucose/arabinose dehydrogenase